jgi:hypothetical protein
MRKKSLQMCGYALMMGIFGAFLLWIHTLSAFEDGTGLPIPNSPWSWAVAVFMGLNALILLLWVRSLKNYPQPRKYADAFESGSPVHTAAAVAIGGLMALGAALNIFPFIAAWPPLLGFIAGVSAVFCAVSMITFLSGAAGSKRKRNGKGAGLKIVFILLFLCAWLLDTYKAFAADPVLWHFAPRILAISASALAFYYIAGIIFGHPKPLRALYFSLLSTLLCLLTLPDSLPFGQQIMTLALSLMTLLLSFLLINNMRARPPSGEDGPEEDGYWEH